MAPENVDHVVGVYRERRSDVKGARVVEREEIRRWDYCLAVQTYLSAEEENLEELTMRANELTRALYEVNRRIGAKVRRGQG